MSERVRFGFVGCGGAALDVAAAIGRSERATLVATHDLDRARAQELASPFGARVHDSLDELLADPAVEAVYVALPHRLLAPTAQRVLASGRSALVEKPMALDVATVTALADLADARGLTLGVMFEIRQTGAALVARELIAGGAIGDVACVRMRTLIDKPFRYWHSGYSDRVRSAWRARRAEAGGGVVLMNVIHQIDVLRMITGMELTDVHGYVGTLVADRAEVEVEDTGVAVFRMSNGALGSLVAGAHVAGMTEGETIEIDGTQGSLRTPDLYGPGACSVYLRSAWRDLPAATWTAVPAPPADPFLATIDGFASAVRQHRPAPAGASDAAAALDVVLRLYASATTTIAATTATTATGRTT
jgi:1,5-anhydro-D-fructose reductase (1,5-anhydro-D-mannitol-forming)